MFRPVPVVRRVEVAIVQRLVRQRWLSTRVQLDLDFLISEIPHPLEAGTPFLKGEMPSSSFIKEVPRDEAEDLWLPKIISIIPELRYN